WSIRRTVPVRRGLEVRAFSGSDSDLCAGLVVSRFTADFLAHLQRDAAHLGNLVAQMDRQTNRLRLIRQRALDRLFDPPCGVGAKLAAFGRIETLDRFHQTD